MLIPAIQLPKPVPIQRWRAPQDNIPQTRLERENLKRFVVQYVNEHRGQLTPPLVLDELRSHAEAVVRSAGIDAKYTDYTGVLVNNEVWREHLACVPYERRLLLLPKCLRVEDRCPAPFDELGLLCKQCGLCSIQDLQEEAERLGYAVLVAEGSAIVMALIQTGRIDAIVGVSCLSVLERAFPYVESAAIPGIAIPLLQDDCKDTVVDLDWVWDVIHLTSEDKTWRLDLDALRREVESWFTPGKLESIFGGQSEGHAEEVAREWLLRAGKRWRPFLTVCAYRSLCEDPDAPVPDGLKKVAVAVECFHKASLIHDDIEDGDGKRYGEPALHASYGVPVALNAGDLLVGEGYRLLAESGAPPAVVSRLVSIAAAGHRTLCLGQGAELAWGRERGPLSAQQVLEIFRRKTAPAFEVALRLGAAYAGAGDEIHGVLARYSEALGIAYQIRDDLDDLRSEETGDLKALRPSLPLAIAFGRATGDAKALLEKVWLNGAISDGDLFRVRELVESLGAAERSRQLFESYKEAAVRSLPELQDATMKGLLRRVVGKIFHVDIQGWCSEFEARNASGGEARAQAAG
jgi:geranylgeranyl diphosphate synthase type II